MSGRVLIVLAALAALAVSKQNTAAQIAPKLDYEFFKSRVEPVFLTKRPDHARCYVCHAESNNAFHLEKLSPDAHEWTDEQSRRNFEMASKLVNPGDPDTSRLLLHRPRPRGRRRYISFWRTPVSVEARPGLADARRVGQWSDALFSEKVAARGWSGMFRVLMRLGTSPTGITATSFLDLVSIAEIDRNPALET